MRQFCGSLIKLCSCYSLSFYITDTAYGKNKENSEWYYFDDSSVSSSSEDDAVVSTTFMLIHQDALSQIILPK